MVFCNDRLNFTVLLGTARFMVAALIVSGAVLITIPPCFTTLIFSLQILVSVQAGIVLLILLHFLVYMQWWRDMFNEIVLRRLGARKKARRILRPVVDQMHIDGLFKGRIDKEHALFVTEWPDEFEREARKLKVRPSFYDDGWTVEAVPRSFVGMVLFDEIV